jgi:hypothetical protein
MIHTKQTGRYENVFTAHGYLHQLMMRSCAEAFNTMLTACGGVEPGAWSMLYHLGFGRTVVSGIK